MATKKSAAKAPPPEHTHEEARYLRYLADHEIPVVVTLHTNETFTGVIEFYDLAFIRLTRQKGPNLFIYKHDIKYIYEQPSP